jgi:hypothetical protein
MANQSPDRRRMLEMLAKAAVASQFPGFSRWVFAGEPQPKVSSYQRQYFNVTEYQAIENLTEIIIPADETPGAKEAGVAEFIDFMAAHGDRDLPPMREGLQPFLNLKPAGQEALLRNMSGQKTAFFELIRRYTVMGYYTSRVGLEELNYPGLEFYSASPECPHKNDPEHLHLPPPKV